MKLTINNALDAIRKMVECHFKTVESFNGRGERYHLIDNDHENIEQFMREMTVLFKGAFKEEE